ncbi:putative phage tail protein [Pseudomonas taetrolens]|uniref:putative phage tail protein n=1 Tax=Pseudomonas taetrolens TaxID=47884 RepID=UPI0030DAEDBF
MSDVLIEQLQTLLPPVSYNPEGEFLLAQLTAEGTALGDALVNLEAVENAIFPNSAGDYIADWERVFDLVPSPGASQESRVIAVVVAMGDLGGQSTPYFIALAKRFGLVASVDVNRAALTGLATVNSPVTDGDALYEWTLNVPLDAFSNSALEMLLQIRKPANTEVSVGYGKAVASRAAASADRLFNSVNYIIPEATNG